MAGLWIDKGVDINAGFHLKTKYDGDDEGDNDDKVNYYDFNLIIF